MKTRILHIMYCLPVIFLFAGGTAWGQGEPSAPYKEIAYSKYADIKCSPCMFKFTLINDLDEIVWSEEGVEIELDGKYVYHYLGSVVTLEGVDFSQQMWVQTEVRSDEEEDYEIVGERDKLEMVPYSLNTVSVDGWYASDFEYLQEQIDTIELTPGPPGINCWDLNGSGACDVTEDVNGDSVCDATDCTGQQGPQGIQGEQGPPGPPGEGGADTTLELCKLYQLTGNAEPDFCGTGGTYQCADGLDNDGDGLTDYPSDAGCWSDIDNDETDIPVPPFEDKIVFISSEKYTGNLGGVSGADAKCQTLAGNAGWTGTYKAWISDNIFNTPDARFSKWELRKYVLPDKVTVVADNWSDLTDGTLDHGIDMNELGGLVQLATKVWTNVNEFGGLAETAWNNCAGWTSDSEQVDGGFGRVWEPPLADYQWTRMTEWDGFWCDRFLHLYCFEQ